MIARLWRGQTATAANTDTYSRHLTGTVFPSLKDLAGHRGAWVLRRQVAGQTEFLAVTLWESRQAIEAFAGTDIDRAIIEPEARAVLAEFDDFARHYEVAFKS
jgi:heme-degrading monooxygenase HmoA